MRKIGVSGMILHTSSEVKESNLGKFNWQNVGECKQNLLQNAKFLSL